MELLLLSSSRTPAGYLTDYLADIRAFSAGVRRALFVPFAAVALPWDEYAKKVSDASGLDLEIVEQPADLSGCDLIVVGGGNTFQLLRECRTRGLLAAIQEKVRSGTRYLGWRGCACPIPRWSCAALIRQYFSAKSRRGKSCRENYRRCSATARSFSVLGVCAI